MIHTEEYKAISRRRVNRGYHHPSYNEIYEKLECVQRAQAQTREQIETLRLEVRGLTRQRLDLLEEK